MSRFRNWCFTLNNFTHEEHMGLIAPNKQLKYLIFGVEEGEEGTSHFQGYAHFHNAKTFSQVKAFFGERFHIEQCQGSPQENIAYCSKDGLFTEIGEPPTQGKRADIANVKEMVKDGKTMYEIYEEATSYQSIRMAEIGKKLQPLQPREKPTVKWYWGATGTGKTRKAYEELGYETTWVSPNSLQWFDGYDGQKSVIIDDFRANQCTFAFLLRLLDRYPMKVPIKGGFVSWIPMNIIITSTHQPVDCWRNENINENIGQLIRRLDLITQFE